MKVLVSILICLSAGLAKAQDNSQKTFWSNGVNAAAYTNITIDKGTVDNRDFSNLRLLFGFQFLRLWDVASLSVGYGKVGFYDAVHEWSDEPNSFQFNYQGPTVGLVLAPNWYVTLEAIHWFSPKGEGAEKLEGTSGDYYKYDYEVSESTVYFGVRIWDNLKLIVGAGQRTLKGSVKGVRNGADSDQVVPSSTTVDDSDSYLLIGVQGTQLIN